MVIVSYDIKDDKLRARFAKMLRSQGAVRLQFSVYEINNTQPSIENINAIIIEKYGRSFTAEDSVIVFNASIESVLKFGNAIHRDRDVVYF